MKTTAERATAAGTNLPTVLIMDADELICRAIARELRGVAETRAAENADEALTALEGMKFDAVVSGLSGVPLFQTIRDRFPETRRILVSGSPLDHLVWALDNASFDAYVPKPLPHGELARAVRMG